MAFTRLQQLVPNPTHRSAIAVVVYYPRALMSFDQGFFSTQTGAYSYQIRLRLLNIIMQDTCVDLTAKPCNYGYIVLPYASKTQYAQEPNMCLPRTQCYHQAKAIMDDRGSDSGPQGIVVRMRYVGKGSHMSGRWLKI